MPATEFQCYWYLAIRMFRYKHLWAQGDVRKKNKCRFGSLETDLMWKSHLSLGYKVFVQTQDVTYWICVDGRQQGKVPRRRSVIRLQNKCYAVRKCEKYVIVCLCIIALKKLIFSYSGKKKSVEWPKLKCSWVYFLDGITLNYINLYLNNSI